MLAILFFVFGSVIGSFLNVVIDRIPKNLSIVYPPSHCPHCKHRLAWYDLIPIVSYFLLGGKCRYCGKKIPVYHPIFETFVGTLFVVVYSLGITSGLLHVIYLLAIASIFVVIFFTDYKYGVIPLYAIILGCIIVLAYLLFTYSFAIVMTHLLSGLGAFGFFFLLFLATKGRGMGFGDVMLVVLLGFFLGFPGIAIGLYLAFVIGAIFSLFLILIRNKRFKHDTIPFGPFLIFGTVIASFFGPQILAFVSKLLLL